MSSSADTNRIDTASRLVKAPAGKIFQAFLDPAAIATWRPPEGMKCRIYDFDPREGGSYRMAFGYKDSHHRVQGKTSEHEDVFTGRFLELVSDKRMVELVAFESDNPDFAGQMKLTTTLTPVDGGTKVTVIAENVPAGIKPEDHYEGMASTLANLAKFVEQ